MKESPPLLQLQSVSKGYQEKGKLILDNFNLTIEKGSFVTIIGPSGSGKTTILNLIGGFIKPDKGKILLSGIDIKDISADLRPTSTVFQDYALFPHLNVFENISFGLKKKRIALENYKPSRAEKMKKLLNEAKFKSDRKLEKLKVETDKFTKLFRKWTEYLLKRPQARGIRKKLLLFYLGIN